MDASNYFFAGENHWEGSDYGPYRLHFSLYAQLLFDRMTDGRCAVFSDDMQAVATTLLHYVRPDNQALRIGDFWSDIHTAYSFSHYAMVMFYAGNYYKDPVLKNFAWEHLNQFSKFAISNNSLSPVMLLTLNDPAVPLEDHHTISLTRLTKAPLASVFARALLFPRNDMLLSTDLTFMLSGDGETECYLAGMQSGTWMITDSAGSQKAEVAEGENLLTFKASAGNVTVTPVR